MKTLTHKDMTQLIREAIKAAGIKARCRLYCSGSERFIQVYGVTFEAQFSESEQRQIRTIAKANSLTWVRGLEIDVEQMTNPQQFNFSY